MITIKTIENPEFKNCCEIDSNCGTAYRIKQNAKRIISENKSPSSSHTRRNADANSDRLFRDEFEEMIALTHQMYDKN